MKSWLAFGLFVVLSAAFLSMVAADDDDDIEQGVHSSIILYKQIEGHMFGVGEEFNVSLVTCNVGSLYVVHHLPFFRGREEPRGGFSLCLCLSLLSTSTLTIGRRKGGITLFRMSL
jgi:hypothetical protein